MAAAGERGGVLGSSNGCSRLKRLLPSPGLLEYSKCPGLLLLGGRIGCVRVGVEEPHRPPYCSRWAESSILRGRQRSTALSLGRFASAVPNLRLRLVLSRPELGPRLSSRRAGSTLASRDVRCAADAVLNTDDELKCQACLLAWRREQAEEIPRELTRVATLTAKFDS